MAVPFFDLTRQDRFLSRPLTKAISQVVRGGQFILGSEVSAFEGEFAALCHNRFSVGVASGTDALELALRALGIGAGDLVATVSFTFLATADAILQVGATPLFVDIDPATYTMDAEDLAQRISRLSPKQRHRLKAVIPVHLFGHPCEMDAIGTVARRYHLQVIEDAAQAAGAKWKGRPVGALADAGCFSFFPTKNLGGFGDGGAVVTQSAAVARRLRVLRVHGRADGQRQRVLGRNSRLDELQAAILRVKLRHLPHWVRARQQHAAVYLDCLQQIPGIICPTVHRSAVHAFHLFVVRSKRRDALQRHLHQHGISTQVYYRLPVHRQELHRSQAGKVILPHTDKAAKEVLALPMFPELRLKELKEVCRVTSEFFRRA